MALEFLSNFANAGGGDLLSGIAGLFGNIQANKSAKANLARVMNQQPTAAETRSNSLIEALLQPNNSLVNSLADEGTRTGIEGLLKTLHSAQMMDQRAGLRGRRPTFSDPERRDEFIDYAISRGAGGIRQNALDTARQNIASQAAGLKGFIPMQQSRMDARLNAQNQYDQFRNKGTSEGIQQLLGMLKGFGGGSYNGSAPMTDTQWNSFLQRN